MGHACQMQGDSVVKEAYWDQIAHRYDSEIFDTLLNDQRGALREVTTRLARSAGSVCDFGCGVGRFLPLLRSHCQRVTAVDFSARSLEIAKSQVGQQEGLVFKKRDLTKKQNRFCHVDLGLLIHVVIMPSATERGMIFANVRRNLCVGGHLVVAVPSLESALYTYSRLVEWHVREGLSERVARRRVADVAREEIDSLTDGTLRIRGTLHKHYLREELISELHRQRFETTEVKRIEYLWKEDFESPPRWLGPPLPWDWLIVAQRTS